MKKKKIIDLRVIIIFFLLFFACVKWHFFSFSLSLSNFIYLAELSVMFFHYL